MHRDMEQRERIVVGSAEHGEESELKARIFMTPLSHRTKNDSLARLRGYLSRVSKNSRCSDVPSRRVEHPHESYFLRFPPPNAAKRIRRRRGHFSIFIVQSPDLESAGFLLNSCTGKETLRPRADKDLCPQ